MLNSSEFDTGVVLHRRPYRETSMIVDFFTLNRGRISAVVRGMRQSKSDKKSLLQPFQQLQLKFSGKAELKTLSHVELLDSALALQGDALYCGLYINELICRVLPQGLSCEHFYQHYVRCLAQLSGEQAHDITLRQFEFALLDELGVLPDLSHTYNGEPLVSAMDYAFHADQGLLPVMAGENGLSGQALLDIVQQNWHQGARRAAKVICRKALTPFLGAKPLHSRALFKRS